MIEVPDVMATIVASREVILQVIKNKYSPLLWVKVCLLSVLDLRALDFVINRF